MGGEGRFKLEFKRLSKQILWIGLTFISGPIEPRHLRPKKKPKNVNCFFQVYELSSSLLNKRINGRL
jgi:hypothetical protein